MGASAPEDPGMYFSWGSPQGYYADEPHNFSNGSQGSTGSNTASAVLGAGWALPSDKQALYHFLAKADGDYRYKWVDGVSVRYNDLPVQGLIIVYNPAYQAYNNGFSYKGDKMLFFPAAGIRKGNNPPTTGEGYYWYQNSPSAKEGLQFSSSSITYTKNFGSVYSYWGLPVRAVKTK